MKNLSFSDYPKQWIFQCKVADWNPLNTGNQRCAQMMLLRVHYIIIFYDTDCITSKTKNSKEVNPIQPSLFENWFSNFLDALENHLQIQLKLSFLFKYGVNGRMFELLHSMNEFLTWNFEQFATQKTGGGGHIYPPPSAK